jgi:glycerophosphoryl diester phosphodiesterase
MAWEGFQRIGHGGASALAPANTLASFDAAVAVGIGHGEFDVRERRGELVLAHTIFHAPRAVATCCSATRSRTWREEGPADQVVRSVKGRPVLTSSSQSSQHLKQRERKSSLLPRDRWSDRNAVANQSIRRSTSAVFVFDQRSRLAGPPATVALVRYQH